MDTQINRIRERMINRGCALNPICSLSEISHFENIHGISLPEDYKLYLLNIANGGDGPPEYGISKLGGVASDMSEQEKHTWSSLEKVNQPFPFTDAWITEEDEESEEGTFSDIDNGSIYIGNDGCGMYWHLIVTGPERGNMWLLTGEGISPTTPRHTFLSWLEAWLDGNEYF
jgi:hypothetical protein